MGPAAPAGPFLNQKSAGEQLTIPALRDCGYVIPPHGVSNYAIDIVEAENRRGVAAGLAPAGEN